MVQGQSEYLRGLAVGGVTADPCLPQPPGGVYQVEQGFEKDVIAPVIFPDVVIEHAKLFL